MSNIIFFLACSVAAAFGSYYGQPLVHENADALLIIITVFTVFAGFLVAIITVIGDPAALPEGWKAKELRREPIEFAIIRHNALFTLYLVTIAILFIGSLLNKAPACKVGEDWKVWIDRSYLFLAILSFLITFTLPRSLRKMQLRRLDAEITRLRQPASPESAV